MTNRDRIEVITSFKNVIEKDIQLAEIEIKKLSGILQRNAAESEKIGFQKGRLSYAKAILCAVNSLPQKFGL